MTAAGPGGGTDELAWLGPEEKEAWTGLVSLILLLPGRLEAPLQAAAGLTLFAAAPTHVRAVRKVFLDRVSAADGRALARVAANLRVRPTDLA